MTKTVAIIGASGYTGAELIRILATHPDIRIGALCANANAGIGGWTPDLNRLHIAVADCSGRISRRDPHIAVRSGQRWCPHCRKPG